MSDDPSAEGPVDDLRIPRESFWKLVPRRDLTKALALVVILLMIISLKMHSTTIVRRLTDGLYGPSPTTAPRPSEGAGARVRLQAAPEIP